MANRDVEEKPGNKPNKSAKWYIIAVIVILAIIVAWIALSEESDANVDIPPEPVVLQDKIGTQQYVKS